MRDATATAEIFAANRARGCVALSVAAAGGVTRRAQVAEAGSLRVRFPHPAAQDLEAVLVNTAGGIAGGDRLQVDVSVAAGARLTVTSAAAEKVYRSLGPEATIGVRLEVAAQARLAWLPQETILFSGARLARSLSVELAADSGFIACETLYFGRAAMGETLLHGALHDRWRIRREGRLVFAEDLRLEGTIDETLRRKAVGQGARAVSTVLATAPGRLDEIRAFLAEEASFSDVEAAAGAHEGFLLIRLLSSDAQALRRALVMLLGHLTGRALPRTWSI